MSDDHFEQLKSHVAAISALQHQINKLMSQALPKIYVNLIGITRKYKGIQKVYYKKQTKPFNKYVTKSITLFHWED